MINLIVVKPDMYNSKYTSQILSKEVSMDYAENILRNSNTGIEELILKEIPADTFFSYEDEDAKQGLIDKLESENEIDNEGEDAVIYFHRRSFHNVLRKKKGEYFVSVLKTKHLNSNNLFDLSEESDGTNRLFELSPLFEDLTSTNEVIYFIDELERSLHPILAKELLKLYAVNSNSKSQLIFTTHESNLLDLELLRQDEIWFTEKKSDGSSVFYPLSDYKPREDKNIRLGYLEGRFGGIPFLGDFKKIS
jgi:AAA15 family ATPase/GTPase